MITKIDVDVLKILEQMILKMGKKLRTANLNSKFTGSYGSSSSLFQSQRSLKSQSKHEQSLLTKIFTGNSEEAK